MEIFKCKMCGGDLSFNKGDKVAVCDYCGTKQTIFYFDESKAPSSRFTIIQKPEYSVYTTDTTETEAFINSNYDFCLGRDYNEKNIYGSFEEIQHLLITGASGYGKTNCLNSILYSVIYKHRPDEVKLLLIDPKKVEFYAFAGLPHLLVPIINDGRKACGALGWAVSECLQRLHIFSTVGVRDINAYNNYASKHDNMECMSRIVIVIDDLYQVISNDLKNTEESLLKILQNGRITGMHLIVSSLQADRKFLPDKIKNSIPSKISFVLRTKSESKYIFDRSCAEKLTTVGDMLYLPMGCNDLSQIKCGFIDDNSIRNLVSKICNGNMHYFSPDEAVVTKTDEIVIPDNKPIKSSPFEDDETEPESLDPLFDKAVEIVLDANTVSTSYLQRKLNIGYARGAKIIDQLEEHGIIGSYNGANPREVLITKQEWYEKQGINYIPEDNIMSQEEFKDACDDLQKKITQLTNEIENSSKKRKSFLNKLFNK